MVYWAAGIQWDGDTEPTRVPFLSAMTLMTEDERFLRAE